MNTHEEFVSALVECESFRDVLDCIMELTHDIKYENWYKYQGKRKKTTGLYVKMKTVSKHKLDEAHPILRLFMNVKTIVNDINGDVVDREDLIMTTNMYILTSMFDVLMGKRNHKVSEDLQTDGTVRGAIKLLSDIDKAHQLCKYAYTETRLRVLSEIFQDTNNPDYQFIRGKDGEPNQYIRRENVRLDDEEANRKRRKESKTRKPVQERKKNSNPAMKVLSERYLPRLTPKQREFCEAFATYGTDVTDRDTYIIGDIIDHDNNVLYTRHDVSGYLGRIRTSLTEMFEEEGILYFNDKGRLVLNEERLKTMEEYRDRYYQCESYEDKMLTLINYMEEMELMTLFGTTIQEIETFDIYDAIDWIDDNSKLIEELFR